MRRPATATLEEVAFELQISMRTVYRRIKDDSIPAFKMGAFWRVRRAWLDEMRGEAATLSEPSTPARGPHAEKAAPPARNAQKDQDTRGHLLVH
jgi:excisionase family DNA binding protein